MRIKPDEMEKVGGNSNSSEWLKLPDDGDVARVQFLYQKYDDLDTYACHRVKVGDYERYVDCNRKNYDDPVDDCPFCKAGIPVKPVMYLAMYDHGDGKIKIWERGKTFIKKIEALFNRYPNLSEMVFEIERRGAHGDKKTTYEVFPMTDVEPVDVSEFTKPEFVGGIILDKTVDEMQTYLDTGEFPVDDNQGDETRRRNFETEEQPVSRRSRRSV